jgi:hypothetical protein
MADESRQPKPYDNVDWDRLYRSIGLDSVEMRSRLIRMLVVHSLLDRLLTLLVAMKVSSSSEASEAVDIEKALQDVAPLPMPTRVDRGVALGVITPSVAGSIAEFNRMRNHVVHFKPRRGKPAWDMSDADVIASEAACNRCLRNGIEAAQALMASLRVLQSPEDAQP